ncbi:MAG: glycosyltransferase [Muribaculaceae bacterium]|nr:glycosyltransferase [Muribaculaceae bacterium]
MKFSIIVPFYNVEQYIECCLKSLWLQDFPKEEYEIIAVNDCSPDNTEELIRSLMPEIPNLRIVCNKKNLGLGGARNTGIQSAKGDYILFVDSDDCWLRNDVLTTFDKLIEKYRPTVIRSVRWRNIENKANPSPEAASIGDIKLIVSNSGEYFLSEKFFYNVWTSCYNRKFIIDNQLHFREKVAYEDSDWTTKVLLLSNEIVIINYEFYGYRLNPLSLTNNPSLKTFRDNVESVNILYRFLQDNKIHGIFERGIYRQIKKSVVSFIFISRYYQVSDSLQILKNLSQEVIDSILTNYPVSAKEKGLLLLLKNQRRLLLQTIKYLTRIKRTLAKLSLK